MVDYKPIFSPLLVLRFSTVVLFFQEGLGIQQVFVIETVEGCVVPRSADWLGAFEEAEHGEVLLVFPRGKDGAFGNLEVALEGGAVSLVAILLEWVVNHPPPALLVLLLVCPALPHPLREYGGVLNGPRVVTAGADPDHVLEGHGVFVDVD